METNYNLFRVQLQKNLLFYFIPREMTRPNSFVESLKKPFLISREKMNLIEKNGKK
jgi:hypothetical protein